MEIAWANYPGASFAGGAMIGVAALFLMLLMAALWDEWYFGGFGQGPDWPRLAFVIGVIVGPFIYGFTGAPVERQAVMSGPLLYVAAFLVGLGCGRVRLYLGSWYLWFVTVSLRRSR